MVMMAVMMRFLFRWWWCDVGDDDNIGGDLDNDSVDDDSDD